MAIVGYGWVRYVSFLYTHMYAYIYTYIYRYRYCNSQTDRNVNSYSNSDRLYSPPFGVFLTYC